MTCLCTWSRGIRLALWGPMTSLLSLGGIEHERGRGHIDPMWLFALKRFLALLAASALLVSLQMQAMPATALLAPSSTEIVSQANPVDCESCDQQPMTVSQCVAICSSTPILAGQVAPSHISATGPEIILAETLSAASVEPELTPPRI